MLMPLLAIGRRSTCLLAENIRRNLLFADSIDDLHSPNYTSDADTLRYSLPRYPDFKIVDIGEKLHLPLE
jgi:hypothetical protein